MKIIAYFFLCVSLVACSQPPPIGADAELEESCLLDLFAEQIFIQGGDFLFGEDRFYPEEGPKQEMTVHSFHIDATEVTNSQFAAFVAATGYQTRAERGLPEPQFADLPEGFRIPGSSVFVMPGQDEQASILTWWKFVPGAYWRQPKGPGTSIKGKEFHPVVHIAYEDAVAYAEWAGRRLPTESEWEYAARGGLAEQIYEWGAEAPNHGAPKANTWQGIFPYANSKEDGYQGAAPVGCYEANGYGLYDMTGNVWEWTSTPYTPDRLREFPAEGYDPSQPDIAVNTLKGGSYLCADNFCYRYRPAARHAQDLMLGTSHIGFRTVADGE